MISFLLLLFVLLASHPAEAAYLGSAHANSTTGVKRVSTELSGYSRGNCAHCHEQHASIAGVEPQPAGGVASSFTLFAPTNPTTQDTNFCLNCHKSTNSEQSGGITNNNYAATFGGTSNATYTTNNIYDAFNPSTGSTHDLARISALIQTNWPSIYNAKSNPCSACHNSHIAKKNNSSPYDPALSAISLPDDRENLWGDDASERMDQFTSYRAPFYAGANPAANPTLHEPDGQTRLISSQEVQGSSTPDYNTFCLKCHANTISGSPQIEAILWSDPGAGRHGTANAPGTPDVARGARKAPYTIDGTSGSAEDLPTNFVLSCLDCHEPHGSRNDGGEYLLRTTVNGVENISIPGPGQWYNFCAACHTIGNHTTSAATCNSAANCHGHPSGNNF